MEGTIFNIRRYSIEDGPGIRTTVFFKGCPLNCWWCHNPESQGFSKEILWQEELCIDCRRCLEVCPQGLEQSANCLLCGLCVDACLTQARVWVGETKRAQEVHEIILKDRLFYDESGGGVTFSGGEPLSQPEFLLELLKLSGQEGIHRTLDTSGYSPWPILADLAPHIDLFLYDLKHMDGREHEKYTGVDNTLILNNLANLIKAGYVGIVRMPLIPGINDSKKNLDRIIDFFKQFENPWPLELLPYHHMQINKYEKLNREYKLPHIETPTESEMDRAIDYLRAGGLEARRNIE